MVKNHPDYNMATKGLNEIFGQLKVTQPEFVIEKISFNNI